MERTTAAKVESVLADLAKDCEELAAESSRGKITGAQEGIAKVRELSDALKSLIKACLMNPRAAGRTGFRSSARSDDE